MDENRVKELFSRNLLRMIEEKGVQQKDVAEGTGFSVGVVNGWVHGKYAPRTNALKKLCEYFLCEVSDFFKEEKADQEADSFEANTSDERFLLHSYRTMTDQQRQMMSVFVRGLMNNGND